MYGPQYADEEEGVVEDEGVTGPHAQVGPRDEEEVDHEDHVQWGLGARAPARKGKFGHFPTGCYSAEE